RTLLRELAELRAVGILSRKKGWGNEHSGVPNHYEFNLNKMNSMAVAGDVIAPTSQQVPSTTPAGAVQGTNQSQQVPYKAPAGALIAPLTENITKKKKNNCEVNGEETPQSAGLGSSGDTKGVGLES